MTLHSNIFSLRAHVLPALEKSFSIWQGRYNEAVTSFPGFVSLEFLSPTDFSPGWLIVIRFKDSKSAQAWHDSSIYSVLLSELKTLTEKNGVHEISIDESNLQKGVTEVIVTEVNSKNMQSFREWTAKIHQVEAAFPGFRGAYVQAPESKSKHWITLLQFDTLENLEYWLNSKERKKLLKESSLIVSSFETHRVISPFAGWFAAVAKDVEIPVWKQTMLVLLVLYPIVMLEFKYLSPFTEGLHLAIGTFIGNAISVILISFPMMPLAIWSLGWWLNPDKKNAKKLTILGTFLVIFVYLIEIAFFYTFDF